MAGALSHIRVLDLSRILAGPTAGQLLGDLGADVIKIEPPGGEATRRVGPFLDDIPHPDRSLAFWIVATLAVDVWERVRPAGGMRSSILHRLGQLPRAMVGMMVAHLGVAAFILGVTIVSTYQIERDVTMQVGDTTEIAGYTFTFRGVREVNGPNYEAVRGTIDVTRGERAVLTMSPEKRVYRVQNNPMTEAGIYSRVTGDLYVSLGTPDDKGAWVVRVYYKPFVTWIWGGCVIMALGGLLAASDRRYRVARRERVVAKTVEVAA